MIFSKLKLSSHRNVSQNIHDGKLKVSQNKLLAKNKAAPLMETALIKTYGKQ